MDENKKRHSLSPDVTDLMQKMPGRLISYSSLFFLLLTLTILLVSWFVKYPDLIEGQVSVKTLNPPIRIVSKSSGELINFKVKENEQVTEGQVIAEVKSLLTPESRAILEQLVADSDNIDPKLLNANATFGEMQPTINQLRENHTAYTDLLNDAQYENKMVSLRRQLKTHNKILEASKNELSIRELMMETQREKFDMYEQLLASNAISKMDFLERKDQFYRHQIDLSTMQKSLTQQELKGEEIAQNISSLQLAQDEKLRAVKDRMVSAIATLRNYLSTFETNYQLVAPADGTLSYLTELFESQFITSGTPLFAIIPEEEQYVASMQVSQQGFGKVSKGQKVIIELDQFPAAEFGKVYGEIQEISLLQNQNNHRVTIALPEQLNGHFEQMVNLPPESSGMAKIVTEDLRLLERLFHNLRKLTSR